MFTEKLNRNGFEDDLKQQYQTLQRPKDPKMVSVSHLIHSHNLAEKEMMRQQYHYPGEWPAIDIQRIIAVEAMIYHAAPAGPSRIFMVEPCHPPVSAWRSHINSLPSGLRCHQTWLAAKNPPFIYGIFHQNLHLVRGFLS